MSPTSDQPDARPVFDKCPRCSYLLRGLPVDYACPECGLKFDEKCELYRAVNPKQVLLLWAAIFGGGWMNLRSLPHLVNFAGASTWERTLACLAIVWVVIVVLGARFVIILYRRGFLVAVTSDGLFVRLPASKEAMIPWTQIASAEIKEKPAGKPQVAKVIMKGEQK